jgi:crotonobetainyl-CoA:carnitine CoA-transferase CaiB-like acyl-CoA transferase
MFGNAQGRIAAKVGLDPETVCGYNSTIFCSITGYGRTGPYVAAAAMIPWRNESGRMATAIRTANRCAGRSPSRT